MTKKTVVKKVTEVAPKAVEKKTASKKKAKPLNRKQVERKPIAAKKERKGRPLSAPVNTKRIAADVPFEHAIMISKHHDSLSKWLRSLVEKEYSRLLKKTTNLS